MQRLHPRARPIVVVENDLCVVINVTSQSVCLFNG